MFVSARQKIDEDLAFLDRQLRLQAGEEVEDDAETETSRPAQALLGTPMVSHVTFDRDICMLRSGHLFHGLRPLISM